MIDGLRSARRSRMLSKLRSRGDSLQILRTEYPIAGVAYLRRFEGAVCAVRDSMSGAALIGCLISSLMIGCQGVDIASHHEIEPSSSITLLRALRFR